MSRRFQSSSSSRRRFLKSMPVAISAGLCAPALAQSTGRISKSTLECGELLTGVDFDDAESELMLALVNTNREHYEAIRRVPVPVETEPAFSFRPRPSGPADRLRQGYGGPPKLQAKAEAGPHLKTKTGPHQRTKAGPHATKAGPHENRIRVRVTPAIEQLAFEPAVKLGALIAARVVTSADLTRMYLDRLARFDERLKCVITLTEALARTVEDCAAALDAMYGPDGRDDTVADVPFAFSPSPTLTGMRLGYVTREVAAAPENATGEERARWAARRPVLEAALDVFRAAGATLVPIDLPDLPAQSLYSILNAEAGAMFDDLVRGGAVRDLAGKSANHRANQLRAARHIPAVEYIRAQRVRTLLIHQMNAIFTSVDAFLAPSTSASVTMTNLTGHPAVVLKSGFVDGMPEAVMVTGRQFDEATILGIAHAYERATPWKDRHPTLT